MKTPLNQVVGDNRLMKAFWILTLFSLSLTSFSEGNEEKHTVLTERPSEKEILTRFTQEDEEVKTAYESCNNDIKKFPSVEACVWDTIGEDKQKEIYSALEEAANPRGEDSDEAAKFSVNLGIFNKEKSPALRKLEEYLKKRLHEALYGENSQGQGVKGLQDHTTFYRLYKSQLGKNLISNLSAYCIYSDPKTGHVPFKDDEEYRKLALKFKDQNLSNLEGTGKIVEEGVEREVSASFIGFDQCIKKISSDCTSGSSPSFDSERNKLTDTDPLLEGNIVHPCEVNRYMTGVKQALTQVDGLIEEMGEGQSSSGLQVANLRNKEPLNTDDVVNIGSKELVEESGYKEASKEEAATLKECAESNGDAAGCDKYLADEDESKRIEEEFNFRAYALEQKIKDQIENNDDIKVEDLKKYFDEQGMSDGNFEKLVSQITAELKDGETVEGKLKSMIKKRYEQERIALRKSLRDRLNENLVTADELSSNPDAKKQKFTNLQQKTEGSPEDLAAVYHYSNVVSSFFKVNGDNGSSTNTRALAVELDSNFFSGSSARGPSSGDDRREQDLENLAPFADSSDSSTEDAGNAVLEADDIDKIQFGIQDKKFGENP